MRHPSGISATSGFVKLSTSGNFVACRRSDNMSTEIAHSRCCVRRAVFTDAAQPVYSPSVRISTSLPANELVDQRDVLLGVHERVARAR